MTTHSGKTKTMRSSLGRVRGLGSAHSGTAHWWAQRATALALVLLLLYLTGTFFIYVVMGGYDGALYWLRNPVAATAMILLLGVGFYHSVLGLQVVIEDYVHAEKLKMLSLLAIKFIAVACTLFGILTTVKILFGV